MRSVERVRGAAACTTCGANVLEHHILVRPDIAPVRDGSRIVDPTCAVCGAEIAEDAVLPFVAGSRKVVVISGPVGAGKSTLGRYIEQHYGYVFVDGDAVGKRVNHQRRLDPTRKLGERHCYTEAMRTVMVTLGLGYNVVVGYIFDAGDVRAYRDRLAPHGIDPLVRVLLPGRDTCLRRDVERPCWTAGTEFVDRWYRAQQELCELEPSLRVDSSLETVEETIALHFGAYLEQDCAHG